MSIRHHAKTLDFGNYQLSGYYGFLSQHDGLGGFDYLSDFLYMNQSCWTNIVGLGYHNGWCDSGYQNLAAAVPDTAIGWIYEYGVMETATGHAFTLLSLIETASWSKNAQWDVISYAEQSGQLVEKGSVQINATFSKAEAVRFNKFGNVFKNIAAVAFEMVNHGSGGNTCTYGSAVYGYQMCIDKVRFRWGKKIELRHDGGNRLTPYELKHPLKTAPHAAALQAAPYHTDASINSGHDTVGHHANGGYHSQILSLDHAQGLTDQFALPQQEHFGT